MSSATGGGGGAKEGSGGDSNPGAALASAVDLEMHALRLLQEESNSLRSDLQVVLGQRAENEMVLQEFDMITSSQQGGSEASASPPVIYKQIGPVLVRQDFDDARQTVTKRLDFIKNEIQKLEEKIGEKDTAMGKLSVKVQQMQQQLQATTLQAVQAIAAQHNNTGSN